MAVNVHRYLNGAVSPIREVRQSNPKISRAPRARGYNIAISVRFYRATRQREEGICVIRIILKPTGKSTRLSVW